MTLSVIFSTYNSEAWLEKTILGFSVQTFKDFEIIIADDGSREATRELIDRLRKEISIPIIHVWQEDNGFQKSQILNKAIMASTSDYLIFTDGEPIRYTVIDSPVIVVSPAGVKRAAFVLKDTYWTSLMPTDKKDVEDVQKEFIVPALEQETFLKMIGNT